MLLNVNWYLSIIVSNDYLEVKLTRLIESYNDISPAGKDAPGDSRGDTYEFIVPKTGAMYETEVSKTGAI